MHLKYFWHYIFNQNPRTCICS